MPTHSLRHTSTRRARKVERQPATARAWPGDLDGPLLGHIEVAREQALQQTEQHAELLRLQRRLPTGARSVLEAPEQQARGVLVLRSDGLDDAPQVPWHMLRDGACEPERELSSSSCAPRAAGVTRAAAHSRVIPADDQQGLDDADDLAVLEVVAGQLGDSDRPV